MSHVDEGMLHAYLDGGLSALDAVRVERHVADCGPCRQRLDQARALIQRAARLLEWASPPADRAAPPLADLRPVVPPRWRVPVAWAATIIIALGAGIYGGQRILAPRQEQGAGAADEGQLLFHDRPAAPTTVVANADSVQRREAAKTTATPTEQAQVGVGVLAASQLERDSAAALNQIAQTPVAKAPQDTTRRLAQDSLRAFAVAAEGGAVAGADTAALERRQVAATPAAPAEPQVRIDGAPVGAARMRRAAAYSLTTTWPAITRDSAARLLHSAIVALPDVPITAVRATGDAVVVEHVVPPGQLIRLVQRRVPEGEESGAAVGNELLARYIGGLRVEISGTLPADSLSRLLERVRAMP